MAVAYEVSIGEIHTTTSTYTTSTFTLTAANLLLVFPEGYDNDSTTWRYTAVELGNGTAWESLTQLGSDVRELFGSGDSDLGSVWYIESPTLTYDRVRITFDGPITQQRALQVVGVTGANVGGTEAALFPNFELLFRDASGDENLTMTGGSNGDMGLSWAIGFDGTSNSLDPTINSQTSREDGYDAGTDGQWAMGTKDFSGGSTVGMSQGGDNMVSNIHIAQLAAGGATTPKGPISGLALYGPFRGPIG